MAELTDLTENPAALRHWMVSGPEMARVIGEFEMSTEKKKSTGLRGDKTCSETL